MSKRKPKTEDKTPGAPAWMATYGDMMSLLLTFFIMLVSMSSLDMQKIKVALGSLKGAMGIMQSGLKLVEGKEEILSPRDMVPVKTNYTSIEIYYAMKKELKKETQNVQIIKKRAGFVLRMDANLVFKPGGDELRSESFKILDALINFFEAFPFDIRIEGHTDDTPLRSARFDSNWDLSVARAITVARYILERSNMPKEKIAVAGYGEARPIAPNDTPENRAKNRRVDIVLATAEGILTID
ncbi:MAG: hypothetical protein A2284_05510 [Deltaproteobacteria bacterium RIFOXYA12_FULL_61_11]|nr:MAG: hypothetical protein A2284_05510 [Deltaproteobacteria bacterium RIFOXYA12_FULL_61_11]